MFFKYISRFFCVKISRQKNNRQIYQHDEGILKFKTAHEGFLSIPNKDLTRQGRIQGRGATVLVAPPDPQQWVQQLDKKAKMCRLAYKLAR